MKTGRRSGHRSQADLRRNLFPAVFGMLTALAGPVAQAQDPSTDLPPQNRWTFVVAPYIWLLSLNGDARVKGIDTDIDLPFKDAVKDLSFGAMLFLDARRGRFGLGFNGVFTRSSVDEEAGPLDLDITTDLATFGLAPYYRLFEYTYDEGASGRPRRVVVEPQIGVRINHLRTEIEVRGRNQFQVSETWADPVIGARFAIDLLDSLAIAGQGDVGGFGVGSDLTWNVQAFIAYRTSLWDQPLSLVAGYRALSIDYDRKDFKWDVVYHGPILGAAFRF